MLIFGMNMNIVNDTKNFLSAQFENFLSSQFEMKYMGEDDVILGVKLRGPKMPLTLTNLIILRKYLESLIHLMFMMLGHVMVLVCIW